MFWLKCSFWLCGLLVLSVPALADTPRLDGTRLVLDGKPVAESKTQPVLSVTGKPLTIRVSIVHEHPVDADGEIIEGKKWLYFFDADNKFIGFVYNEDAEGVRDVVQSPDQKVIAIRSATTDGGHGLELLLWPELKLMPGGTDYVACATFPSFAWANNTFYYTASEMVNAVGRFDAPGKATTSRTGVPEEADMQSVIAVDMATGAEKLVVRGTPLCDMRVLQVEGDNLVLGKYCMAKEGDWAKKKKPVEEHIVIPLAAIEAKAPDLKGENRALLRDIHAGRQQAKELCPTMPFLYCMTEDRQLLALCAREEDYG